MFFSLIKNSKFPLKIHCNEEDIKNPFTTDLNNIFLFIRRNNTMINNPNTSIYRHIILRHYLILNNDICFHNWYHKKNKLKITFHIRIQQFKI